MNAPLTGKILVVEDDDAMRNLIAEELEDAGCTVFTAIEGREALRRVEHEAVDVVIADVRMPGMKGDDLQRALAVEHPEVPVVLITAFGSIEDAVNAMRAGAHSYVAKPFRMSQLLESIAAALRDRRVRLSVQGEAAIGEPPPECTIVAESAAMRSVVNLVHRAAAAESSVLITGETGTGKELIARTLHRGSRRAAGPFVAVNCAAIPESLLESQLFGHRRGAFTDAREDRTGLFLEADGGTLFLDEVGDLSPATQSKILRALQEREVHPLGASRPVAVDVRLIAATNLDLTAMVAAGRFRRDLVYRLNVISVEIPPLRDRPEDVLALATYFTKRHAARLGIPPRPLAPGAVDAILRHDWPGNARELENAIERALVLGTDAEIRRADFPEAVRGRGREIQVGVGSNTMADVEQDHILRVLRAVSGNKAAAARLLGLDRKTLYRKLRQFNARPR